MQLIASLLIVVSILNVASADPFWKVFCDQQPIYRGRVDPIVNPGSVSGHSHRVFGASAFDMGSRSRSYIEEYNRYMASKCTTCSISIDKSAYWVPDLYYRWPDGSFSVVPNAGLTVYYPSRSGFGAQRSPAGWRAFPPGLRMLAGSPFRREFNESDNSHRAISYVCIGATGVPERNEFPSDISRCTGGFRAQLWFPMCWDGVNLDSPNHKSHMSYPVQRENGGDCPATHPVRLPGIFFEVLFSITSFPRQNYNPFLWSSGDPTGYGFHGDFLNGWDERILQAAINDPSCDAISTNNGNNVAACRPFAPHIIDEARARCTIDKPIHTIEDLGMNHPLVALPGCNPVIPGGVPGQCSGPEPQVGPNWARFLLRHTSSPLFVGAPDTRTPLTVSATVPYYTEVWTMITVGELAAIKSDHTGRFVTSPRSRPLVCDRAAAQAWELFNFTMNPQGLTAIQAQSNGLYLQLQTDRTIAATSTTPAFVWQLVDPGLFVPGGSGPAGNIRARAVTESDNSFADNGNSGNSGFPFWVIGVVAGVVVVIIVVGLVLFFKAKKSKYVETA